MTQYADSRRNSTVELIKVRNKDQPFSADNRKLTRSAVIDLPCKTSGIEKRKQNYHGRAGAFLRTCAFLIAMFLFPIEHPFLRIATRDSQIAARKSRSVILDRFFELRRPKHSLSSVRTGSTSCVFRSTVVQIMWIRSSLHFLAAVWLLN